MGNNRSKEDYIRKHPVKGDADDFYFACKEGNIEHVKQALPGLTLEQLNKMHPNGSTYLHVSTYYGRTEIVRLLLEHGCIKAKLNLHGLTAYEKACTDDIRVLFHRPRDDHGENRFVDQNINETFHLTSMLSVSEQQGPTQTTDNNDIETDETEGSDGFIGNDWVEAFNNFDKYSALILSTTMKSKLFYRLIGLKHDVLHQLMKHVLEDSFKQTDQDYNITGIYLNEYIKKKTVSSVIYLYMLETSFYSSALRDTSKCAAFTMLLYRNLSQLTERFYKGRTYRGMKMTKKDLDAYRSMTKHKGYALMNTKFQSSSIDRLVAEEYLWLPDTSENNADRRYDVLMIYDFHEVCQSAINLMQINGKYLSEYPHEAEVLILPYTLFEVCHMEYDATKQHHVIYLKNIIPPGILSSFKLAMKEFMNMSPNELHQSIKRLENNLNAIRDFTENNSN